MTEMNKHKKQPNLHSLIVNLIINKGPLKLKDITKILDASYQSLNTEALELRRLGLLQKDDEGVWSLVPGADLSKLGFVVPSDRAGSSAMVSTSSTLSDAESSLSLEDKFEDLLRRAGVAKGMEATITEIYFTKPHMLWDTQWLHNVLIIQAWGYVTEGQARLIMASWSLSNGFPCKLEDFFKI